MTRIEWNKPGERFFEAGVDRGVLYPKLGPGVAWNGLTAVGESTSGGDLEPLYYDGVKYLDLVAAEFFQATIDAYSAPAQFAAADGQKTLAPGLFASQQLRQTFGMSYRTLKGNDLVGENVGYKVHIVYNCTASPSSRSHVTIGASANPGTRSWTIDTVPPAATTFKPTAHLVVDSNLTTAAKLAALEDALYGTSTAAPYLPTVDQVVSMLA